MVVGLRAEAQVSGANVLLQTTWAPPPQMLSRSLLEVLWPCSVLRDIFPPHLLLGILTIPSRLSSRVSWRSLHTLPSLTFYFGYICRDLVNQCSPPVEQLIPCFGHDFPTCLPPVDSDLESRQHILLVFVSLAQSPAYNNKSNSNIQHLLSTQAGC